MERITDIAYRPICIGRNDYRYIGFADMGYIGRYFISTDTDMPTLVGQNGFLSDFEKIVYWLNYRPKCPQVADFFYFSIIPMR